MNFSFIKTPSQVTTLWLIDWFIHSFLSFISLNAPRMIVYSYGIRILSNLISFSGTIWLTHLLGFEGCGISDFPKPFLCKTSIVLISIFFKACTLNWTFLSTVASRVQEGEWCNIFASLFCCFFFSSRGVLSQHVQMLTNFVLLKNPCEAEYQDFQEIRRVDVRSSHINL